MTVTNSMWVTLHFFWQGLITYQRMWVVANTTLSIHLKQPLTSLPMTNRKWVTINVFNARQSHHILKDVSDNTCSQSQVVSYIFSHNQQGVSDTRCFLSLAVSLLLPWPTGSEWHWIYLPGILIISFPMANRQWVMLDFPFTGSLIKFPKGSEWHWIFLCQAVTSHHFSQWIGSEWTLHLLLARLQAVSLHLFS